jgi:Rrf2 family transcriptional regulator, repressor of oqxAB
VSARLGRPADQITLGQIYHSAIGDKTLWAPRPEGPREWLITTTSQLDSYGRWDV